MSYQPKVNADTLTLYLGLCATGRATASSTTLDNVAFGTVYNPQPGITFEPEDEGMPIAICGGGPVDALMPAPYFVQGAMFHTTIATYISPSEVILTEAPDTSIWNTGFATVILYRPVSVAADWADAAPAPFQLNTSIAPGTSDTLQFSTFQNFKGVPNPYIDRFGAVQRGQPVYLIRQDDTLGLVEEFGGYIDTLTTSSYPSLPGKPYCWSATCASWQGLAARRVVPPPIPQVLTDVDGDVAFRTVVLDYLSNDSVSVTAPTGLPQITIACAVGANIGQLLDQIVSLLSTADQAYYWTSDAWRNYILGTRAGTAAPWDVSDGSDLYAGDTPNQQSITVSGNQLANNVTFIGQSTLLNALNATFLGDGTTTVFNTPLVVGAAPTITLNSGSQTVGILGVDTGKDWYYSQGSTAITQDAGGTVLAASDTLVVSYLTATPAVAQSPNVGSLQQLQAIEGTSANYDYNSSITQPILPADLLALANGYEAEYGEPATTCQFYTLRPGLATGQLQTIALPDAGIPSGSYLIATLQMTLVDNVIVWQYTAFGGANIGNALTQLTQFINRNQASLNIVTPVVPITGSALPTNANNSVIVLGPSGNVVAYPNSVVQGDLLICVLEQQAFLVDPPILTDTMGNTWTLGFYQAAPGFSAVIIALMWAIAAGGGPNTVTFTNGVGGTTVTMGLAEFSGVIGTSPVDTAGGSIGASAPLITTTQDGDLIISAVGGLTGAASVTSPEVLVITEATGDGVAIAYDAQSSAGSFDSSIVPASASLPAAWVTVAFKRAPATAPPAQTINVQQSGFVPTARDINTTAPLTGGGSLASDLTLGVDVATTSTFGTVKPDNSTVTISAGVISAPGGSPLTTKGDLYTFSTANARLPVGADGKVLTADSSAVTGVSWQTPSAGGGGIGVTVYSGLAGISLSGATIYFAIGGGAIASSTEADVSALMESSGTITGFGAKLSAALGTTLTVNNSVVLTWRKNGSPTSLTCTITNPSTSASDVTHSFAYAPGDVLSIQAVFTGTISAAPVFVLDASIGAAASGSGGVTPNPAASAPTTSVPFSGWSIQNQGNAHGNFNDFLPNEIVMSAGNYATLQWSGLTRSLPGATYTLICTIEVRGQLSGNVATLIGAVCLSDGTNYEQIEIALGTTGANVSINIRTLSGLSTGGSILTSSSGTLGQGLTLTVKVVNDGTHRTFFYWLAGAWAQLYQEASGTFLTETQAGITGLTDLSTGGYSLDVAVRYWSAV